MSEGIGKILERMVEGDHVIGDEKVKDKIQRLELNNRIELDHHLIVIWIEGKVEKRKGRELKS